MRTARGLLSALLLAVDGMCAGGQAQVGLQAADSGSASAADIHETVARVSVTVPLFDGTSHTGDMIVTHFRPEGPGPFPAVVMSHGRSSDRARRDRFRFMTVVRYWTRRGFAVAVPTRLGYGAAGLTPDPEFSGPECSARDFGPMTLASSRQIRAAVEFMQSQQWVDGGKVILMGHSVGGLATTVATGGAIPGVIGSINSAGGSGGRPATHPGRPCSPDRMAGIYAAAGKSARTPMLWLYAGNDLFWGAEWPRRWHQAFVGAGGAAEFVMGPPVGDDGHRQIDQLPAWRPYVDRFIARLGFAVPQTAGAPGPTDYAALAQTEKIPYIATPEGRGAYEEFLKLDVPRAFAVAPDGSYGLGAGPDALPRAMRRCRERLQTPQPVQKKSSNRDCRPYAVDDAVVWVR
jgi:dienelactone hydrolase